MLARPPEPSQHCPRKALTHQRTPLCRRAETRNAPAARPGLMCIPRQACAPRRCPVLLRTRGAARSAQHPAEHPVQNIALHHQLTIPGPARQPSFCSALVAFPAHNSRRSSPGFPKRLGPVPTLRLPPQRPGPHPRRPRRLAKFHFCPASCPPALPHRGLVGATKLFASVSVGSNERQQVEWSLRMAFLGVGFDFNLARRGGQPSTAISRSAGSLQAADASSGVPDGGTL